MQKNIKMKKKKCGPPKGERWHRGPGKRKVKLSPGEVRSLPRPGAYEGPLIGRTLAYAVSSYCAFSIVASSLSILWFDGGYEALLADRAPYLTSSMRNVP